MKRDVTWHNMLLVNIFLSPWGEGEKTRFVAADGRPNEKRGEKTCFVGTKRVPPFLLPLGRPSAVIDDPQHAKDHPSPPREGANPLP